MVSARTLLWFSAAFALEVFNTSPHLSIAAAQLAEVNSITTPNTVKRPLLTPEQRGDIYMARKMYREAAEAYKEGDKEVSRQRGFAPSGCEAAEAYKEGDKESAVILNKIGIAYHQMLELDVAKKHYERAIKKNPKYPEAINNLGTVHYAKKSYRRAVGQYNKALKINPNSAAIYSNLGTAQFARKKYNQAFDAYQKALAMDSEVFERRSTYGILLQDLSVEERAKFHFYLAKTYAKAGMNDRALLYIRKALEEGFKEKDKLKEDPEFGTLRDLPEFAELMALQPRVL